MLFLSLAGICVHTKYSLGIGAVGQELFHLGPGLAVGRVCGSLFGEEGGILGLEGLDRGQLFQPQVIERLLCRTVQKYLLLVLGIIPLRVAGGFIRKEGLSRPQIDDDLLFQLLDLGHFRLCRLQLLSQDAALLARGLGSAREFVKVHVAVLFEKVYGLRHLLEVEHLRPALIARAFALGELSLNVYEQARPLLREPLVVALAAALRSLDNGQPVLDAERVAQRPHRTRAAPKVVELAPAVQCRGVPKYVVVDVPPVSVGADDVGVFALEEALGKLHADAISFLRRDLARLEGLSHLVGYDVARLLAARELPVLPLGQQKLRVRRVWVTGKRGDQFSVFGLVWVHCISRAELERRSYALAAVHGYDPRYRYAATSSAIHGVLDCVPQSVQLSYEPRSEHRQPVGAYEEGDAQYDDAVHGAVEDKYGQTEQPQHSRRNAEHGGGNAQQKREEPARHRKHGHNGRAEYFQKDTHFPHLLQ